MKRNLVYGTGLACAGLFALTLYLIFYWAPLDVNLFFSQKIFYYHVPNAFMLFISVFVCGIYSIRYLKRRDGKYDDVAHAAGELAVVFGAIVLVTGSIWGRAAWGVWWQWDERLTTSLLLWMIMVGYVLVRKFGGPNADRLGAGLAIFGMVDVPLIYFSVKFGTVHPDTTAVPTLLAEMRITFWLSVLLFLGFFLVLLAVRVQSARLERRLHEIRELGLDAGVLE